MDSQTQEVPKTAFETLDVVRREGDKVYVLGHTNEKSFILSKRNLHMSVYNAENYDVLEEHTFGSNYFTPSIDLMVGGMGGLTTGLLLGGTYAFAGGELGADTNLIDALSVSMPFFGAISGMISGYVYSKMPKRKKRRNLTQLFNQRQIDFRARNRKEQVEKENEIIPGIETYQGGLEEVANQLDAQLEYVNTGNPEKFLRGSDRDLRLEAANLGAELLINYTSTGREAIATPVKHVNEQGESK